MSREEEVRDLYNRWVTLRNEIIQVFMAGEVPIFSMIVRMLTMEDEVSRMSAKNG